MKQENPISPEEQYIGVDPQNIIRMQMEIAIEALAEVAYDANSVSYTHLTLPTTPYV